MKHPRLLIAALAVTTLGSWTLQAAACDHGSKATAASGKTTCTAAMAAGCTAEMAAACKAKSTGAAHAAKSAGGCPYHDSKVSAVTAGATGAAGGCGTHGSTKTASGARLDGVAGGGCSGHGMANATDRSGHADCDACTDMAFCDGEVRALGAVIQVVPIKNGLMYVYTAEGPSKVQALQAAMARRIDRMGRTMGAGEKAHLCAECKSIRGAVASGKLTRELVNIESGCLTLVTSSDRSMVARIYSMAGIKGPLAAKS